MSLFRKLVCCLLIIVASTLSGCGSGGSGTSSTSALALTVTAPADSTQTGSAVAIYTAGNGQNLAGMEITFSTDSNIIALGCTKQSVDSDGHASISFRALPVTTDTTVHIIATTGGVSQSQSITIKPDAATPPVHTPDVPPSPQSISFLQAQPTNISLKGMGGDGRVETSIVSFVIKDAANSPLANQTVDFILNTTVGGLTLTPTFGVSDSKGIVRTIVTSGTMSTSVRVAATVRGTAISVQSDQLTVSTGVPAQDGLSISLSNPNAESFDHDGVAVQVTARLSDHFQYPVPDGATVAFAATAGAITSSCTTTGGACTVNWTSQGARPLSGRAVLLAYAVGEESFLDSNGNGVADTGTCSPVSISGIGQAQQCGEFIDTPEAYRDDNFNGVKDVGETFIDFNSNRLFNAPDSIYNGLLRPSTVTGLKSKHVFYNSEIVMSTDTANITVSPDPITGPGLFNVTVTDLNGNTMASGTTVTISVPFGTVSDMTFTISQNTGFGLTVPVNVAAGTMPTARRGAVTIVARSPGGKITTLLVPISGNF